MKALEKILLALLLGLMPIAACAEISVDSLNYPVWIKRGTETIPLAPGDRLQAGDLVQTGASGRLWLKLEGGSVIKLGQDALLAIDSVELLEEDQAAVLEAGFRLLQGASRFRSVFFTTRDRATQRHEFQFGEITAAVRSADIWGRAGANEDFVALRKGRIEVTSTDQGPLVMDQAMTRYRKVNGEPAGPVDELDSAEFEGLAGQTELDESGGLASTFGPYNLVLYSYTDSANVDDARQRFLDAGYAVRTRLKEVDGTTYTRIQLEGLIHLKSANGLRQALIAAGLIEDAWVSNPE